MRFAAPGQDPHERYRIGQRFHRPMPARLHTWSDTFSKIMTVSGRTPSNLIASAHKPDIRFTDAIDNDVEVVADADKVLVYDRPIASSGLRWRDL